MTPGPRDGQTAPRAGSAGAERDAPPALELPAPFGKYYLTEKLATGGMAELYLAKLIGPGGFEKSLVIKQIHPKLSGQRHFVDLFVAEAKTLVTLAHGNIVPVYELGVIDDTYFIAMEYIDGPTLYRLTEVLRRRGDRMAPAVAAWIAARVLEGLDYAHRKGEGVIHRDLSPRNVMLSRDGEVKLVDFGIAVTLGTGSDDDAGQSAPTGSFPYMSPEQVRKQALTVQTDLFSLGVLLWEMLAGRRLFARSDPDATLRAVLTEDIPPPSTINPTVPPRLDEVVLRALERDTAARWPTASDMLAALQRYLYSLDETPGPRDVAALVARYCPPETRRYPTHHDEAVEAEVLGGDPPRVRARTAATGDIPRGGPMTAVIPRDGAGPRGKRPTRARTETFATHVELEQMLELAVVPVQAEPAAEGATAADTGAAPERVPSQVPGHIAPSRALLVLAALGTMGLGVASVVVFMRGRDAVEGSEPGTTRRPTMMTAATTDGLAEPGPEAPAAVGGSGAPPDAAAAAAASSAVVTPSAAVTPPVGAQGSAADPAPVRPRDRAQRPAGHAATATHGDPPGPRVAGMATLTVGAIPWGTVLVDGKPVGRTPIDRLAVSAGHHVVSVTFSGDDPARSQAYTMDLVAGETRNVVADFTHP